MSYVTVIDVPNPELKLKPGMTANVTVEVARADDVLRVPSAALRFRPASASGGAALPRTGGGTRPRSRHRARAAARAARESGCCATAHRSRCR